MVQFSLLVLVNLFVGSMVGLERTVLPLLGEEVFGLAAASATLSFIVAFGFTKALVNLAAGALADRFGRKRILIFGWAVGIFVPVIVIVATAWWQIVLANVLLGVNQGLTWSMTVNMKMDLATSRQRGLALGLNEFAGYSGLAVASALSGLVAAEYFLRPETFYLGIAFALVGLVLSVIVRGTEDHLASQVSQGAGLSEDEELSGREIFARTTLTDPTLASCSVSGLATNLKDGMAWGLFPLYFAAAGLAVDRIGIVVAVYPAAWGVFQLFTGPLSDRLGRKWMIVSGMLTQAGALWLILLSGSYGSWLASSMLLGLGTALVYPTLLAAISDAAHPSWRASSLGVYRAWRDSGYAFGALIAGVLADLLGAAWSIGLVALLPLAAGLLAAFGMQETLRGRSSDGSPGKRAPRSDDPVLKGPGKPG
ncbi:MFS transporter [Rubrobacter radiotolerans]|nr:MFS transporter [Rubrobacter radiotolerans]